MAGGSTRLQNGAGRGRAQFHAPTPTQTWPCPYPCGPGPREKPVRASRYKRRARRGARPADFPSDFAGRREPSNPSGVMAPVRTMGTLRSGSEFSRKRPVSTMVSVPCEITMGAPSAISPATRSLTSGAIFIRHLQAIFVHQVDGVNLGVRQAEHAQIAVQLGRAILHHAALFGVHLLDSSTRRNQIDALHDRILSNFASMRDTASAARSTRCE